MAVSSMKRSVIRLAVIGSLLPMSTAFAAPPTTAPTTNPADFPADAPARTWFARLASADPIERDAARDNLMSLTSDQLPMLKSLIAETRSLSAAQVVPLHDIVVQMFLSGERYPSQPGGFIGLRWSAEFALGLDTVPRLGVPVDVRLPGFPSYGVLRRGDMILGVLLEPDLPLTRPPNTPTATQSQLTDAIRYAEAGRRIDLQILRAGEVIHVKVKLAPHPMMDFVKLDDLFSDRELRAEKYWQAEFLPLLLTMS